MQKEISKKNGSKANGQAKGLTGPTARYRGLAKNGHQLYTLFGLVNLVIGARRATA